jgi:hypothetical protein
MAKKLHEMTFAEAVREGIELELDAVVQGRPLHLRVHDVMELALRWASDRRDAAKDDRIGAS